jgi:hypothetical protein
MSEEELYQMWNVSTALCRNINDNYRSVSFEILDNGDIQVKVVLSTRTEVEEEYIDDMSVEIAASDGLDRVLVPIIEVGNDVPLKNVVYRASV